jgi:uncharacterized protein YjdB
MSAPRLQRWRRRPSLRLICMAVLVVASCDSPTAPDDTRLRRVATVSVDPTAPSVVLGSTLSLRATVRDEDGNVLPDAKVVWSVRDPGIASVSAAGVVTPRGVGSTQVAANVSGQSAIATVTIQPKPVASVALSQSQLSLASGESRQLSATPSAADGEALADRAVVWTSNDSRVATVSVSGVVTAIAAGSAIITATSEGKSAVTAVTVIAPPLATVAVQPSTLSLIAGRTSTLAVTLTDVTGAVVADRSVTWTTSDALVATVSDGGSVTAVAPGSATVTATSEGKTGSATVSVMRVPVGSVSVEPSGASVPKGESITLTATVRDADGSVVTDRPVAWSSSNTLVATVSETGVVKAVAPGSATIDATAGGKSGSTTVTVTLVPVATVSVNPPSVSVVAGRSTTLAATLRDASGQIVSGRAVAWSSSNTLIATVSSSGVVTAIAPGAAAITATSEGRSGSSSVTVTPVPVATVTVAPTPTTLETGATITLSATLKDAGGATLTNRAIAWSSSNSLVASVSGTGVVTAVSAGSATITATGEGVSGTASVTVKPVPVGTVAVQPTSLELDVGRTSSFSALVRDANGTVVTGRVVTWTSSNTAVATVTSTGVVKAIRTGSATITATSEGKSGGAQLTATPAPVGSVVVSPSTVTSASGQSVTFSATVRDTTGGIVTDRAVAWSSSDSRVATVTPTGVVTALGTGTGTIVATSGLVSGSGKITVTPGAAATVTLSPETVSIKDDESVQLTATAKDAQGNDITGRTFTWTTSDGNTASVSSSGLVRAKRSGTVTITATLDGKFDRTVVTVTR